MEIKVTNKNVYGNNFIYPACPKAELFARLLNKKTFSLTDLDVIIKLGYKITPVENQQVGASILPNDIAIGCDCNGTYLNGYLTASYADLVHLFGQPGEGDKYKVDAEWELTVRGKAVTIYNYKDGRNYNGDDGTPTEEITDWYIGGKGNIIGEVYGYGESIAKYKEKISSKGITCPLCREKIAYIKGVPL